MHSIDDENIERLIKRLNNGDVAAFDAIFCSFEQRLYAYALKLTHHPEDAKEVVQEVFLKVWEKRDVIDPNYRIESFLYTIAKNLVYNKAKKRVYEFAYKEYITLYSSYSKNATEEVIEFEELTDLIQKACQQLPPVRRKVFSMSRIEGLNHQEIAKSLNTSTSNVKNHINKALRFLKEEFQKNEIVPVVLLSLISILL